jgi:hypothetical protein
MRLKSGIFHCHTEFSYDCRLTFAEYRRWSATVGFDFVLLTEHSRGRSDADYQEYRRRAQEASDDRVRLIPGIEYETRERHELIAVNARVLPDKPLSLAESVAFFRACSDLLVLPHPSLRKLDACLADLETQMHLIDGFEITNVKRSSKYCPTVDFLNAYNAAHERFDHLLGLSGQDLHEPSAICPVRLELRSPATSDEAMLAALRAGDFTNTLPFHRFSSRGPYAIPWALPYAGALARWACNSPLGRQQWLTRPVKRLLLTR